jgi:S1-C subfamily serine protease
MIARALALLALLLPAVALAHAPAEPPASEQQVNDRAFAAVALDVAAGDIVARPAPGGALRLVKVSPALGVLGFKAGDVITLVEGKPPARDHLVAALRQARAGTGCVITDLRRGKTAVVVRLCFGSSLGQLAHPPATSADCPQLASTRRADGVIQVKRAELAAALGDAAAGRCARAVPRMVNGKVSGIKLYAIRPGSWIAALGLENGDTLLSVNGLPLDSMDQAREAYAALSRASRVEIVGDRRGKPFTQVIESVPER